MREVPYDDVETQLNSETQDYNLTVAGNDAYALRDSRIPSSSLSRPISPISRVKID